MSGSGPGGPEMGKAREFPGFSLYSINKDYHHAL
jgi:hypothetical protein